MKVSRSPPLQIGDFEKLCTEAAVRRYSTK